MNIEWRTLETPYRSGRFVISGKTSARARSILVALEDETGDRFVRGLGAAVPSRRVLSIDEQEIHDRLQALQSSLEALQPDPEKQPPEVPLERSKGSLFPQGPVACALDGALLDAWAQVRGQPLWRALDLPRPRLATTATVSLGTPEEMAGEAKGLWDAGFSHLKVKIGEDPVIDGGRLFAVREAVPGAVVRVDANEGWSREQAVSMAGVLAEVGVELCEQPLARDASVEDHHAVNKALQEHDIPHVLDETVHTVEDVQRVAESGLAHGVNLKLQKAGGLRPGLALIEEAEKNGLKVMVGCFIETWAGIALAVQLAGRVDWADLDGAWLLAQSPVVPRSPLLEGGRIQAGDEPGLGLATAPGVLPAGPGSA